MRQRPRPVHPRRLNLEFGFPDYSNPGRQSQQSTQPKNLENGNQAYPSYQRTTTTTTLETTTLPNNTPVQPATQNCEKCS